MNKEIENNEWKNEAKILASMDKENSFTVPDGYFENLSTQINRGIFLDQLKSESNFTVPDNYFNNLQSQVQLKIKLEDLKSETHTGFISPDHYFENLSKQIIEKIELNEKPKRILSLWQKNLFQYASAACFVILSTAGLYFTYNNQETSFEEISLTDKNNEQVLYEIDEITIIDHLNETVFANQQFSPSNTDLEQYILTNYSTSDIYSEL